jgi:hypothetical protein
VENLPRIGPSPFVNVSKPTNSPPIIPSIVKRPIMIKIMTLGVFLVAGFSFQGTELIGITAGESENPERAVPNC